MFLILLLAGLLQQAGPLGRATSSNVLSCSHQGVSVPCLMGDCADCAAQCGRGERSAPMSSECSADVDHAEVRDQSGHNQCQLTAPPGKLFGEVSFGGNRQVASLTARPKNNPDAPIALLCEINQLELIPMQPILTCDHCGAGSSFGFDNGHFLSLVIFKYDFANHRLSLAPTDKMSAIPLAMTKYGVPTSAGGVWSSTVAAIAAIEIYADHDGSSAHAPLSIAVGDSIQLLGSWAPVAIVPVTGNPNLEAVAYNHSQEWLQIQVKGRMGWIRGAENFSAIGLPLPTANR
jgi:hypothetical protein